MKLQSTQRTAWYCGVDTETRLTLKRILLENPPLTTFGSLLELLSALESQDVPSLLVIDVKPEEAGLIKELFRDRVQLQNRALLIVSDLAAKPVKELCSELACEFIKGPVVADELAVRAARVFKTPILNAKLTLELLKSFGAELTSTEVKLLFCFLADESRSVTRDGIMTALWQGLNVHPRTFDVHLFNLRKKLIDKGLQILSDRGGKWTLVAARAN